MRIVRITSASELRPLFEFRHHVYVGDLCWLEDKGGLLVDEFDEPADNYAAYDASSVIVGSVRVVPDSPLGLPLERCFPLDGYRDSKRLAEISRLVVSAEHRGGRLAGQLMKAACQRCQIIGATHALLDTYIGDGTACGQYERMGFEPISPPFRDPAYLPAEEVVVFAQDIALAHKLWPVERPGMYRFFTAPDNAIDHG